METMVGRNARIVSVKGREVLDSRGRPTVEAEVAFEGATNTQSVVRAMVPSGKSTGGAEAKELRDADPGRYAGMGCLEAAKSIGVLGKAVVGMDPTDQKAIDAALLELDTSPQKDKSGIGANAVLAVSMACCRAGALVKGVPLCRHINDLAAKAIGEPVRMVMPVPCLNVINGGVHAGNLLAFQEFFLIPAGAESFGEALRIGAETYQVLKKVIQEEYGLRDTAVGDEGGFAPNIASPEEGMRLLMKAIERAGHTTKIFLGSDPAASEFFKDGTYDLGFKSAQVGGEKKSAAEMVELYEKICSDFPMVLLEDPFDEEDFASHAALTSKVGDRIEIVGDDLYCTNCSRVEKGLESKATNAMLLKVNQIGSVTESLDAWSLCRRNGWGVFVSHRSGETEDSFIADLSVGIGAGHIKSGAPCRSERLAKYNQLLRIEEELGIPYAGMKFRTPWDF
ncbi:enolase [Chloropicon primus]|uniref:phosphopyruvate hydratase n=1 Tax=Chloropicon primus TaxID=1764295 RepID=A0A5B8MWM0_9CHLO|nr:enolase [Chloropicon primus]UPR03173.1 enolase [Chloropicon primus]|eukprot:QDZ23962.1 enolase [Chloropicon primus]